MKFVAKSELNEGMVIAKDLYDTNNLFLIKKGFCMNNKILKNIQNHAFYGAYIEDNHASSMKSSDAFCENLRQKSAEELREYLKDSALLEDDYVFNQRWEGIECIVRDIIENILDNNVASIHLVDLFQKQDYLFTHSVNVCVYAIIIGISLNYTKNNLMLLGLSALLHDVGKLFIEKKILDKTEELSKYEYEVIKKHTTFGYQYLRNHSKVKAVVARGVLDHHERFDGGGYPNRRKGSDITEFGRIITLCDVYDALVSSRSYKKEILPSEAVEFIMASGNQQFDMELVKVFLSEINAYSVGTIVKLSNDYTAMVLKKKHINRPIVKLLKDNHGNDVNEIWELGSNSDKRNITIVGHNQTTNT